MSLIKIDLHITMTCVVCGKKHDLHVKYEGDELIEAAKSLGVFDKAMKKFKVVAKDDKPVCGGYVACKPPETP